MGAKDNGLHGFYAGILNTLILQPFDVIRTIQQQEHSTLIQSVKQHYNNHSIKGFYRGVVPTIYRNSIGYALYFNCIKQYQKVFTSNDFISNLAVGCTSRGSVGLALAPLTFLKSRFESTRFEYKSLADAVRTIYRKEGLKTFYTALSATLYRDTLYSGLYFGIYRKLKAQYPIYVSATTAALFSLALTHPLDTVKTKMQIDSENYRTIRQAFGKMSLKMLYSGFLPRSIRRVVQAIVAWSFFEAI